MFYSSHTSSERKKKEEKKKRRAPLVNLFFPTASFSVGWEEDAALGAAKAIFSQQFEAIGRDKLACNDCSAAWEALGRAQ